VVHRLPANPTVALNSHYALFPFVIAIHSSNSGRRV
jgi:hypothetical protein